MADRGHGSDNSAARNYHKIMHAQRFQGGEITHALDHGILTMSGPATGAVVRDNPPIHHHAASTITTHTPCRLPWPWRWLLAPGYMRRSRVNHRSTSNQYTFSAPHAVQQHMGDGVQYPHRPCLRGNGAAGSASPPDPKHLSPHPAQDARVAPCAAAPSTHLCRRHGVGIPKLLERGGIVASDGVGLVWLGWQWLLQICRPGRPSQDVNPISIMCAQEFHPLSQQAHRQAARAGWGWALDGPKPAGPARRPAPGPARPRPAPAP